MPGELHVLESHDAERTWATAWQIAGWQYVSAVISAVLALDAKADDPLSGRVDATKIAAGGHSLGGRSPCPAWADDVVLQLDRYYGWEFMNNHEPYLNALH